MDTEKAEVLLRVLEAGSLSAAAERLGYTPSGVSRIVAALEAETGFPLLRREHRGVRPTAECEQLLPHLHRLAAAQRQYDQEAAAILGLERGQLTVGSSYGSYVARLARAAAAFSREHPGVRVEIMTGSSTELGRALQEGRADLCVISRREGAFDWVPLRRDPLAAVVPADHPLAGGGAFPLERFSEEPFIDILPGEETGGLSLTPVMTVKSRIAAVTRHRKGDSISYGRTWTAERDTLLAVMPMGYADGLPRCLSGKLQVMVRGVRVPQVGRICMDMCMLDITDHPEIAPGDVATVFSDGIDGAPTARELAALADTIPYELTCGISLRVPRIYSDDV